VPVKPACCQLSTGPRPASLTPYPALPPGSTSPLPSANGTRYRVLQRAADTDNTSITAELLVRPTAHGWYEGYAGSSPVHVHTGSAETLAVVSGVAGYRYTVAGGKPIVGQLEAGEHVVIPAGEWVACEEEGGGGGRVDRQGAGREGVLYAAWGSERLAAMSGMPVLLMLLMVVPVSHQLGLMTTVLRQEGTPVRHQRRHMLPCCMHASSLHSATTGPALQWSQPWSNWTLAVCVCTVMRQQEAVGSPMHHTLLPCKGLSTGVGTEPCAMCAACTPCPPCAHPRPPPSCQVPLTGGPMPTTAVTCWWR
jgi:uncharacterized cupin superfamily protein